MRPPISMRVRPSVRSSVGLSVPHGAFVKYRIWEPILRRTFGTQLFTRYNTPRHASRRIWRLTGEGWDQPFLGYLDWASILASNSILFLSLSDFPLSLSLYNPLFFFYASLATDDGLLKYNSKYLAKCLFLLSVQSLHSETPSIKMKNTYFTPNPRPPRLA